MPAASRPDPSWRARLRWNEGWARVRPWEYAATAGGFSLAFGLRLLGPYPPVEWSSGVLFDDAVVDYLTFEGDTARSIVLSYTDATWIGSMVYRFVDSVIMPGLVWQNPDVTLQMTMIDLEAFAFQALVIWSVQALIARNRPIFRGCELGKPGCATSSSFGRRSLVAGHPATVTTAAGLTCLHHAHMPLYGGGFADDFVCGFMIATSVANGLGRMVTGYHYATDVLFGWALGMVSGWVLPAVLHYGFDAPDRAGGRRTDQERSSWKPGDVLWMAAPMARPGGIGAMLGGRF